jgi:hypothetical protein
MTKKPRLALEQHEELGRDLTEMRNRLQTHRVLLSGSYPRSDRHNEKMLRGLAKAVDAIDSARYAGESQLYAEGHDASRAYSA